FYADTTIACKTPFTVNFLNTTPGINQSQYYYHWSFGDGDTSDIQNPTETYTNPGSYTVSLSISDSSGCVIALVINNYIIAHPPVSRVSVNPVACPGAPVSFASQSLYTSSVLWNFGDGDTSTNINPVHKYAHSGRYTVTLTAHSHAGCDSTTVFPNLIDIEPVVSDFVMSDSFSRCPPFVVLFSNLTSPSGNLFLWNFGDGYTDTAYNPTHIYFHPGVYTVKLITIANGGYCTDTLTRANAVTVQGPTGSFVLAPATGCVPLTVSFSSSISSNTQTFLCDLGDGNVITSPGNFTHAYTQARVYHPEYILTDYAGCRVPYSADSITAYAPPVVNNMDTAVCMGASLHLSVNTNASRYSWWPATFIDCDTCADITFNGPQSTLYNVISINVHGCRSTSAVNVTVMLPPALNDSVQFSLCPHDTAILFVGNAENMIWSPTQYLSDSAAVSPLCTPLSSMWYTVTAHNSNGCTAQTQVMVNIKNKIGLTLADSIATCPGRPVLLETSLNGNYQADVQYVWSPVQYLNSADIASPMATIQDSVMQFQLIASNGHCMADTENIKVYTDVPAIHLSAPITTTPYSEVSFSAGSSQSLAYNWWATDEVSCNTCATSSLRPAASQMVYVEGKN
ncbi:MAG TPA: PKD domain-containing protein, partial [Bacteroidia bacterium]|nr:PKD domain-containing protein [Bacteroidia bacterium]